MKTRKKVGWFERGRDAFTEGRPGFCDDGRISGKDRAEWHRGYKHQQSLNATQASEEERRQTAEIWAQLCNDLFSPNAKGDSQSPNKSV